jgi:hypothetical protein
MPQDIDELKIHIQDACESHDMQMLSNVWNDIYYQFDMCRITNGAHNENREVSIKTLRVLVYYILQIYIP